MSSKTINVKINKNVKTDAVTVVIEDKTSPTSLYLNTENLSMVDMKEMIALSILLDY